MKIDDQVFVVRQNGQEVWKVCFSEEIVPAEWNSKGAAEAHLNLLQAKKWANLSQYTEEELHKFVLDILSSPVPLSDNDKSELTLINEEIKKRIEDNQ